LHRRARDYAITSCGQVLMANGETASERALGRVSARLLRGVPRPRILLGGLGMGFTLRALLDELPEGARVVVAELLRPVVAWNRERFGHLADHPLDDPRVEVHVGDVARLLRPGADWDAVLLDVDNGPEWMVQKGNQALYESRGLRRLLASLRPGGFLALWSVEPHRRFERRLARMGLGLRRFRRVRLGDGAYRPLIYVVSARRRAGTAGSWRDGPVL
jgi:spermidine synthase